MPGIKSDLTNKSLPSNRMREIDVPDESGYHKQEFEANSEIDFDQMNALMASRNMPPVDPSIVSAYNVRQAAKRGQVSPEELDHLERQVAEARRAKVTGKERLSHSAKERIAMLCGMSRGTKEVDIDGNIFVLKTLKGVEQRHAIMAASEYDNTVQSPFEIRRQLLARSISEVAGTDIELFLNDSSIEAKLEFIEELDESTLIKLFYEYNVLVNETQSKYFVKTPADGKEVVEDLKK